VRWCQCAPKSLNICGLLGPPNGISISSALLQGSLVCPTQTDRYRPKAEHVASVGISHITLYTQCSLTTVQDVRSLKPVNIIANSNKPVYSYLRMLTTWHCPHLTTTCHCCNNRRYLLQSCPLGPQQQTCSSEFINFSYYDIVTRYKAAAVGP